MRMSLRFWAFVCVLYGASALVQWASFRWLRRVAPRLSQRYRAAILAFGAVLFLLPLSRELAFAFPAIDGFPVLSALGMLWHVCTWMTMGVVGIVHAGAWIFGKLLPRPSLLERTAPERTSPERAAPETTAPESAAPASTSPASTSPERAASPAPLVRPNPEAPPSAVAPDGSASAPDQPRSRDRRLLVEGLAGAAAFAGGAMCLGWGALRGRYDWQIEEVPIRLARLPRELDGFTIVQISDLHVGAFVSERELGLGLGLLRGLRPDLIAVTGDIVDSQRRFIPLAARALGALQARHGVVCIPGNHDHYTGVQQVLSGMRAAGIEVLLNRSKMIPSTRGALAIAGVDDLWPVESGAGAPPNIEAALAQVPPDAAKVLLAHQPRYVAVAHAFGIDLQLSGHTHGGQVNPIVTPLAWFARYVAGRYDVRGTQLYVNRGFGTARPRASALRQRSPRSFWWRAKRRFTRRGSPKRRFIRRGS
jgi:predicted MPP superfamily phosphohydrolase